MRWNNLADEPCSVARSLSVVGDRWTLLILRDCFLGVTRFDHFQSRLGLTRHVLSRRLKQLVDAGIVKRAEYQSGPRRYEYRLTPKGLDLHGVIASLTRWGDHWMAGRRGPPLELVHRECGHVTTPLTVCAECHQPLTARSTAVRFRYADPPFPPEASRSA
ncbi:MAG: winged helix-turn-helix transcriptional regulator [Gemmatimonadales bacterium]